MGTFSGPPKPNTLAYRAEQNMSARNYGAPRTVVTRGRSSTPPSQAELQRRSQQAADQWSAGAFEDAYFKAKTPKSAGGWVDDSLWNARNGGLDRMQQPLPPAPYSPGGGGGRGGGGGGGAADPAAMFGGYAARVAELAKSLTPGADTLTPMVNKAVDADSAAARAALANVGPVSGDPYANLKFQSFNFDPNVAKMLQAQGMGTDAALLAQQQGQAGLDQNAAMWGNYGTAMSANQQASNQAWNADMEQNKAGIMSQIETQRAALLARAAEIQKQKEEEFKMKRLELMFQLLGQGFGAGADVSGVDFGGLV